MTWMDVTGTPSANQNNVDAPAYQCGGTPPSPTPPPTTSTTPPPTTSTTPPPTPPPTAASNVCSSCDGLNGGACNACDNCILSMGSCQPV